MIISNLKLGIKDLFKNFKIFILFSILLFSISLMTISSIISLNSILKNKVKTETFFQSIPLSTELSEFDKIQYKLDNFFDKGALSVFRSEFSNNKLNINAPILLGNFNTNYKNKILFSVHKDEINVLKNKDISFNIINKNDLDRTFLELFKNQGLIIIEDYLFINIESDFKSILDFKLSSNELVNLIESTRFREEDLNNNLDLEFENIISNKDIFFKKHINDDNLELNFILKYMSVFSVLLIIGTSLFFYLFIEQLYKKLFKEYKINIIFGATKKNIFIRNSVFIFSIVIANFSIISYLNNLKINDIFYINIILNIIYYLVLSFVIFIVLNKEDLTVNSTVGD